MRDIIWAFVVFLNIFAFLEIQEQVSVYSSLLNTAMTTDLATNQHFDAVPVVDRKKVAMCAIVKEEEMYIDEWVAYHKALGFDAFFIYDNSEGFEMKQWGHLKGDNIQMLHLPGERLQVMAYFDCFLRVAKSKKYEWVAFFDVDEFLVLKKHDHVADFLKDHCPKGKLGITWATFDTNQWHVHSPAPVTRRFLYQKWTHKDKHIKTIARVDDVKRVNIMKNAHNPVELKDMSFMHGTHGERIIGEFNWDDPWDVAALHHYKTKSSKELVAKGARGDALIGFQPGLTRGRAESLVKDLATESLPLDLSNNPEYIFDDSAWQFLKKNVPGYALYDEIALTPATNTTDITVATK